MFDTEPTVTVNRPAGSLCDERVWFTYARFGIFIHFGLYSVHGKGEDHYRDGWRPQQYADTWMPRFNPVAFDAQHWVAQCLQAGARYLVLTTKHGEGFCLWDTETTDYKVTNTPFCRDIVGEMASACHEVGMRFGLYFATDNWHYVESGDGKQTVEAYSAFTQRQLDELTTNYGQIDVLWLDGSSPLLPLDRLRNVVDRCRQRQPTMVVNDRGVHHNATGDRSCGDFITPERFFPARIAENAPPVEICDSMSLHNWGHVPAAPMWSSQELINRLCRAASMGCNYLLNIEPDCQGKIHPLCTSRLAAIGKWLATDRDAIFNVAGCSVRPQEEFEQAQHSLGWCTQSGSTVYVLLRHPPRTDRITIPNLTGKVERCMALTEPAELTAHVDGGRTIIAVGDQLSATANPVLRIDFQAPPIVGTDLGDAAIPTVIGVSADATTLLHPRHAELLCSTDGITWHQIESYACDRVSIGRWVRQSSAARWRVKVATPTRVAVQMLLGTTVEQAESEGLLQIGRQSLRFKPVLNGSYRQAVPQWIGILDLDVGEHFIRLSATMRQFFSNVFGIQLHPIA